MQSTKKQWDVRFPAKEYTVERDNGIPLTFTGHIMARATSGPSGGEGTHKVRWTILKLYKTLSGQYVCEQIGRTQIPGEVDRRKAIVVTTADQITEFFGTGPLAQKLYREVSKANAARVA